MKNFVTGLIIGLILLPAIAFLLAWRGYVPVETSAPPLPFEKPLAGMALDARIARQAPKDSLVPVTEPNLVAGAKVYRENCAVCHGLPGQPQTAIAKGEYPPAPELLEGKGVTDDPASETFWKVANGIRLTGMPGFRGALTDEQMWQVSQIAATADKLPQSAKDILAQPAPAP